MSESESEPVDQPDKWTLGQVWGLFALCVVAIIVGVKMFGMEHHTKWLISVAFMVVMSGTRTPWIKI